MQFISAKAQVKGFLEGDDIILGPSFIGAKSLIGRNVIVGYPAKNKVKTFAFSRSFSLKEFDKTSAGAKIGNNCIVRSGTVIYENTTIGKRVETGHNVLIREGSIIGDLSRIGSSTQLDGTVKVGKNVSIQSNVYLPHLTVIQDDVFLAPNVVFTNDPYPPSHCCVGIVVGEGAVIGANACIIAPAKIGNDSVVGAGALITKDVPPGTVVVGFPGKPYITREQYDRKRAAWKKGAR